MRIAIVDDNKSEQNKLYNYIVMWSKQDGISVSILTFDNGEKFTNAINREKFDIVFMDIIMDGQNGIDAARNLRLVSFDSLLIFITSSNEYMAQAFPCHAFDYVIKPYSGEKIIQVMREAKRALGKFEEVIEIASERFLLSEIFYAYSDSNYCDIFTKDECYKVRISFTELSQRLSIYPSFMVVGRGVIVNFDNASHISGLDCIMTNGERVPVSRRKIKDTEQAFVNRQFSKLLEEGR